MRSRKKRRRFIRKVAGSKDLAILTILLSYLVMGAFLFPFVEQRFRTDPQIFFQGQRQRCLTQIWTLTESLSVLHEKNWTESCMGPLGTLEESVSQTVRNDEKLLARSWSFGDSFAYCVTILTTIGYAKYAPITPAGKILTMIYASFGIPLMILTLCNFAERLCAIAENKTFEFSSGDDVSFCKNSEYRIKKDVIVSLNENSFTGNGLRHTICSRYDYFDQFQCVEQKKEGRERNFPLKRCSHFLTVLILFLLYNMAGAFVYSRSMGHTLMDGLYFCFAAFSTLGRKDLLIHFTAGGEILFSLYVCAGLIFSGVVLKLSRRCCPHPSALPPEIAL